MRRLRMLGYGIASSNYIIALHLSRGTLDELEAEIDRMAREQEGIPGGAA